MNSTAVLSGHGGWRDAGAKDESLAVWFYTRSNEGGAVHDRSTLTNLLVTCVQNHVGHLPKITTPPMFKLVIEKLGGTRDLAGADIEATEFAGDLRDLSSRNPLDVHLRDRKLESALGPLSCSRERG